ncbi:LacI family transcriptional regulator [Rhizomicrobium palustre]|uniref:LacI family transcriptional regulator n=1 Tax=Rhizomicrobium palustre TaxID=189966 RepID=A0A846N013_9PROT|nr:LacI family DNA-binding transcriptional regulator [Rhizomicrobium palustre]NIK89198.1 LacI family transcriptional regulator [Rhizomicrobium palustre]
MSEVTIKDVARVSGYSIKTVSRVINKHPTVAKDIRDKVSSVVAKLDYQPNLWARSLRSSRSHLLALFTDNPTIAYSNRIQLAATEACRAKGYHLMSEVARNSDRGMGSMLKTMIAKVHLDGAVLMPPLSDNQALVKALIAAKLPFVRISPSKLLETGSYVYVDDYQIAYDMTEYLIELGHRDIAIVNGPALHLSAAKRLEGFRKAMQRHGLDIRKEWECKGEFDVQSGMAAGEALFARRTRPTAVLGTNDETAVGVMAAAYRKGLSIPGDVSIVGIDDSPIASSFWPKLTTMRQPVSDLGRVATEILIGEIEAPRQRRIEKLGCEIVLRDSASAPPRRPRKSRKA